MDCAKASPARKPGRRGSFPHILPVLHPRNPTRLDEFGEYSPSGWRTRWGRTPTFQSVVHRRDQTGPAEDFAFCLSGIYARTYGRFARRSDHDPEHLESRCRPRSTLPRLHLRLSGHFAAIARAFHWGEPQSRQAVQL